MDEELKANVEAMHRIAKQIENVPAEELADLYDEVAPEMSEEQDAMLFIQASIEYATPPKEEALSLEAIEKAYDFLAVGNHDKWKAEYEQAERKDALTKLKWLLEYDRAKAVVDGKIDGKNEETRKAQARELFADLYKQIEDLEREIELADTDDISVCKLRCTVARDNIDKINMKLRFLELAQMAGAMAQAQQEVPIKTPMIQVAKKNVH